ncbi:MAG TPA: SDR family NAD(P)-dependent oxidoreductase [Geminicoccaceae bacterium]|nr:SDR family NAD(P)-dependent oxidoreductase [Geminicoccaceae bacterium]
MAHPLLAEGRVAAVTGAASGIGLATCRRLASLGMRVCMADVDAAELRLAADEIARVAPGGRDTVLAVPTDVARPDEIEALKDAVYERFGEVGLLMNNAATRVSGGDSEDLADWRRAMEVNFWGVVGGVRAFLPAMLAQGTACAIVNTGSKQGITNPPGNLIYNVTKSALKTYTEGLQHELRNTPGCRVSAHLLIPGWTTTGKREHKPGAWLPDQVADVLLAALRRGDFYIMCQDNEVTPEMDAKRILWAAGDIIENRPPLSRWHPDYAEAFAKS